MLLKTQIVCTCGKGGNNSVQGCSVMASGTSLRFRNKKMIEAKVKEHQPFTDKDMETKAGSLNWD